MTPRVTVAIPTWNRAELLRGSIRSVLAQTCRDFELLIIDNASTDHTAEVVASFDDPRIRYLRNPTNIGGKPNMTRALRSGSAPYVVPLFDDDYMLPTCIERKADFLDAHPEVVLVHSSFQVRSADGTLLSARDNFAGLDEDTIETSAEFIARSMLKPCRIHISSAMYRHDAVADEAFRLEDEPADDHALWLRLASKGSIGFISEALDGLHMVPGLATSTDLLALDDDGRFKLTLHGAAGAKRVMREFIDRHDATPAELRRLRRLARRGSRITTVRVLLAWVPGFRPPGEAWRMLVRAIRIEPSILVEPRLLKLFVGRRGRAQPSVRQAPARRSRRNGPIAGA